MVTSPSVTSPSVIGVLLTFAWGLLLYFTWGRYGQTALGIALILGLLGSLPFLAWSRFGKKSMASLRNFEIGLWLLILLQLALLGRDPILLYAVDRNATHGLRLFAHLAGFTWLLYGARHFISKSSQHPWLENLLLPLLTILLALISKAQVISASPAPAIDVHAVLTLGTDYLLNFHNPYTGTYPEIYGGVYGYVPSFSYWPGSLYVFAPFRFFGFDVRSALLLFDTLTAGLLGLIAFRKFGPSNNKRFINSTSNSLTSNSLTSNSITSNSITSKPITSKPITSTLESSTLESSNFGIPFSYTLLWITLPVSFFVLEQAWLDTLIITGAVGLLFCLLTDRFKTAALVAAWVATVKQYASLYVFFALFEFCSRAQRRDRGLHKIFKPVGIGVLTLSALVLPFLILDWKAMYEATIGIFTQPTPFRMDVLSLRTWAAERAGGDKLEFLSNPVLVFLIITGLNGWSVKELRRRELPPGATYGVSSFIAFACIFLFGTHSFCNQYYFLMIWPLLLSLV